MSKSIRICLKVGQVTYKISSLSLANDGSVKLSVPYIPHQEGFLVKFSPHYGQKLTFVPENEFSQRFESKNLPQLSLHSSGFVQFSGPGIYSGIDSDTKKAKGLGVYSAPFSKPIESGPTFSLSFWGLKYFDKISEERKSDLIIDESQVIIRNSIFGGLNSYIFEFFVFPGYLSRHIVTSDGYEILTMVFPQYRESLNPAFTFPVIRLLNHDSFLGLLPFQKFTGFAQKIEKGYVLSGPAGTDIPNDEHPLSVLMALSDKYIFVDNNKSLDYR